MQSFMFNNRHPVGLRAQLLYEELFINLKLSLISRKAYSCCWDLFGDHSNNSTQQVIEKRLLKQHLYNAPRQFVVDIFHSTFPQEAILPAACPEASF